MTSEADVQRAIIEALVFDGWLVTRVNQGGAYSITDALEVTNPKKRYITFARWQVLGQEPTDKGISDLSAMKARKSFNPNCPDHDNLWILGIETKATGKAAKLQAVLDEDLGEDGVLFQKLPEREKGQARFLFAFREHGGIAIVADSLEDIQPYLDRVEVQ